MDWARAWICLLFVKWINGSAVSSFPETTRIVLLHLDKVVCFRRTDTNTIRLHYRWYRKWGRCCVHWCVQCQQPLVITVWGVKTYRVSNLILVPIFTLPWSCIGMSHQSNEMCITVCNSITFNNDPVWLQAFQELTSSEIQNPKLSLLSFNINNAILQMPILEFREILNSFRILPIKWSLQLTI